MDGAEGTPSPRPLEGGCSPGKHVSERREGPTRATKAGMAPGSLGVLGLGVAPGAFALLLQ